MTTQGTSRNSSSQQLVSEIEESIQLNQASKSVLVEDNILLNDESDFLVSSEALKRASQFGVDPFYHGLMSQIANYPWWEMPSSSTLSSTPFGSLSAARQQQLSLVCTEAEDVFLEHHLDHVVAAVNRERVCLPPSSDGDEHSDESPSVREKVLTLRLPRSIFDPLLTTLQSSSRSALRQILLENQILTGERNRPNVSGVVGAARATPFSGAVGSKRKSLAASKKKRKGSGDWNKSAAAAAPTLSPSAVGGDLFGGSKSNSVSPAAALVGGGGQLTPAQSLMCHSAVVAKAIAEGSFSSYLIAIAHLLCLKDPKKQLPTPVRRLVGALFEKQPLPQVGATTTSDELGLIRIEYLPNPFKVLPEREDGGGEDEDKEKVLVEGGGQFPTPPSSEQKTSLEEDKVFIERFSSSGQFGRHVCSIKTEMAAKVQDVGEEEKNQKDGRISLDAAVLGLLTVLSCSADNSNGNVMSPLEPKSPSPRQSVRKVLLCPLIAPLPVAPDATTFLLVDFLLDTFINDLRTHASETFLSGDIYQQDHQDLLQNQQSQQDEEVWIKRHEQIVWSIGVLLRVLVANFRPMHQAGISASSVGLGMTIDANEISFSTASTKPFVLRLLQQVADCTGLATGLVGDYDPRIDNATFSAFTVFTKSSSTTRSILNSRHFLKMMGIEAFTAGLGVFRPRAEDRIKLVYFLLQNSPTSEQADLDGKDLSLYGGNCELQVSDLFSSSQLFHLVKGEDIKGPLGYFELALLQKICFALAKEDVPLGVHHSQMYINPLTGGAAAIVSVPLGAGSSPILLWESPETSGFKTELKGGKGGGKHEKHPRTAAWKDPMAFHVIESGVPGGGGAGAGAGAGAGDYDDDDYSTPLEIALVNRIGQNELLAHWDKKNAEFDTQLCAGELALLARIQQNHLQIFSSCMRDVHAKPFEVKLNTRRCNAKIEVSDDYRLATQKGHQNCWVSVLSTKAIQVGTGIHEWVVTMEKCDSGQAFVGLVKSEASVETYIGGDRNGWGINGNKSLWHDKTKLRSEFGIGFTTSQRVRVRYDSDHMTLSVSASSATPTSDGVGEWCVAFLNLPKVPLFPAVSLFHAGDQISLRVIPANDSKSTEEDCVSSTATLTALQAPTVLYAQTLFDRADTLLKRAESESDVRRKELFLSHPVLGLLVPSLTAGLLMTKLKHVATAYSSIQLLPYLTVISRRMAALRDSISGNTLSMEKISEFRELPHILGNVAGVWLMRSTAVGRSNIPEQEYTVNLTYDTQQSIKPGGNIGPRSCDGVGGIKVMGSVPGGSSAMTLQGTQVGTRLKFLETWVTGGGNCLVEGRVSICGSFFFGIFRDVKSGKGGSIQGFRLVIDDKICAEDMDRCSNILVKSSLLCFMACGMVASNLVLGFQPACHGGSAQQAPESRDMEEEGTATILTATTSVLSATKDEERVQPRSKMEDTVLERWLKSHLFSGGLPFDSILRSFLVEELQTYLMIPSTSSCENTDSLNLKADAEVIDTNHNCRGLLSWWLGNVFPILKDRRDVSSLDGGEGALGPPESSSSSARSTGIKSVDEYVTLHIGQGALSKTGGEDMQIARKDILAAMIKHSGSLSLCLAEETALASNKKNEDDRPSAPLLDVWRATQRVVEQTIRQKQTTGESYASLRKMLCKKCDLLQAVLPSQICMAVSDSFAIIATDSTSDVWNCETGKNVQQDCVKLLGDVVDFLLCPLREVSKLSNEIVRSSFVAMTRAAGFRSFNLLFPKLDSLPPWIGNFRSPSNFNVVTLQPSALNYLTLALNCLSEASSPTPSYGHYMHGLNGLNPQLTAALQSSFEETYESITQMLSKCTWSVARDGQCTALTCWGIRINPSEHVFLNRVGIFKALQQVLETSRTLMSSMIASKIDCGPYATEICLNTIKRLVQSVMRIVHSLASQVAFSKDSTLGSISPTSAPRLQKMPSGPDTLSQSLFDMLYAELFHSTKNMLIQCSISQSIETTRPAASAVSVSDKELLEGDKYMYRILRLLYIVSNSKVCQRSLCSAKWIYLLVAGIGSSDSGVQRRILRLLRRILVHMNPDSFAAYVPSLFYKYEEIEQADEPLDDEDVIGLTGTMTIGAEAGPSSAERIVSLFFEGISSMIPPNVADSRLQQSNLLTRLFKGGTAKSLAAESLVILRVLQGVPAWREVLDGTVCKALTFTGMRDDAVKEWNNAVKLRQVAAALAVNGGYIDRLRLGGNVTIRPMSIVGASESFAQRLTAASHSCGILVGLATSSNSAEVVVMERGIRLIKPQTLSLTAVNPNERILQHTTNLVGSLPVRAMRVETSDIMPSSDVPIVSEFVSVGILNATLNILTTFRRHWLCSSTTACSGDDQPSVEDDDNDDAETQKQNSESKKLGEATLSDLEILQMFVTMSAFRATASYLQNFQLAHHLLEARPDVFFEFLRIAEIQSQCGGLNVIESIEQRWASLWDSLLAFEPPQRTEGGDGSDPSGLPRPTTGISRSFEPGADDSRAQLLEAAVVAANAFSSFGAPRVIDPAMQQAAVAQMADMGLPLEWCEVALRRCRFDVEMAINLCFENGDSMSQIVAEDAVIQQSQAGHESGIAGQVRRTLARFGPPQVGRSGSTGSPRSRSVPEPVASLTRQLQEMGFPSSWCARAMEASNNDVDASLSWILSHSEELVREDESRGGSPTEISTDTSSELPNPLVCISGTCNIKPNLTCAVIGPGGFPSVGCRGFGVNEGKWYYEVTLMSEGCIQVGWVDNAYVGGASDGRGVGDDEHSWAYDGWRTYLWHDQCADWGARWATGDVVGCAVDLDSNVMSFFLNGLGEEIDMGRAFVDFRYCGGLYPAASFNRNEKIAFNLGVKNFAHSPPPGYRPYIEHINAVSKARLILIREIPALQDGRRVSNSGRSNQQIQDALEEEKNDQETTWNRRYFSPDERGGSAGHSNKFPPPPQANLSSDMHNMNREMLLKQLTEVSRDLCILYCRMCVLRVVSAFPRLCPATTANCVTQILGAMHQSAASQSSTQTQTTRQPLYFDSLLLILRLCSVTSARTKIYLMTMSTLPSTLSVPDNLGSILSTGGLPMLNEFRAAFSCLLFQCREADRAVITGRMIEEIAADTFLAVDRTFQNEWRSENGGFVPVIYIDDASSDALALQHPSLSLAVWMTTLLIEQSVVEVSTQEACDPQSEICDSLDRLLKLWSFTLRAPSLAVKLCGIRMLSIILQDVMAPTGRLSKLVAGRAEIFLAHVNLDRLEKYTYSRLEKERCALPICSEYLQSLLDLTSTIRCLRSSIVSGEDDSNQVEKKEWGLSTDHGIDSSFDWEAICGRTCADGTWTTWTGNIVQHLVPEIGSPPGRRQTNEREETPPELLIGCRVCRPIPLPPLPEAPDSPTAKAPEGIEDDTTVSPLPLPLPVAPSSIDAGIPIPPQSASLLRIPTNIASPATQQSDIVEQFGSCIGIEQWPGDVTGTARLIRWDDGAVESVRWNTSDGIFDVVHVKMDKGKKILKRYSNPPSRIYKCIQSHFGASMSFGVILRVRTLPRRDGDSDSVVGRVVGVLEWPDFSAEVFVTGLVWDDGHWTITEERLLRGAQHSSWASRFGSSSWRSGTVFELIVSQNLVDTTDPHNTNMSGNYNYSVTIGNKSYKVTGDISLQRSRLFTFDSKMKASSIHVSKDKLSAAKGPGGAGGVFANVGFSSGVHYWEFKVENCDIASIFIGVAEKSGIPGAPDIAKCSRKLGYGILNNRSAYCAVQSSGTIRERQSTYGDQFLPGDTVGVSLDMNCGRLTFFLDGMKYGEHNLVDLGVAFDNLTSPEKVKPRTLYPYVFLHKNNDMLSITPRWVSSIGMQAADELDEYCKAWGLFSSWSIERRVSNMPSQMNMWVYCEGWREWIRWRKGRFVRARSRCKNLPMIFDKSPFASVQACLRLGLPKALFRGDRIVFTKTSGRQLETKEEAVILGVCEGRLWYRLETSGSSDGGGGGSAAEAGEAGSSTGASLGSGLVESAVLALALAPSDLDGIRLSRRGSAIEGISIPESILDIDLPLIPAFHGGTIKVIHPAGADMRNGLETDSSDLIMNVPDKTVLLSIERRINSSNIPRYRVIFHGHHGWISERKWLMSGDDEEILVDRVDRLAVAGKAESEGDNSTSGINRLQEELLESARAFNITDTVVRENAPSFAAAVEYWTNRVKELGFASATTGQGLFSSDFSFRATSPSAEYGFEKYLEMSTTMDGDKQWHVEADMQLSELISRCALRDGVSPQNLSFSSMESAVASVDAVSSPLMGMQIDRVMARAALIKVANQVFSNCLPQMSMNLPEEKLRCQCAVEDEIDIITSDLGRSPFPAGEGVGGGVEMHPGMIRTNSILPPLSSPVSSRFGILAMTGALPSSADCSEWNPPSTARRLRSLRRLLFAQTKVLFWENILEATTTPTVLPQEEYDEPREIKTLKINRVKATLARLASISSPFERLRVSVFGQLHKEIRTWPNSSFRRSYLSKGHGGQKRAFKVKFISEGVDDYGGPYRAVFEQIVDELQADGLIVGRKTSERCLLPLLIPCSNKTAQIGSNQDKFLLSTAPSTPLSQELMQFFGKLTGTAVRQNLNLGLDFSALQWRALVRLPLTAAVLKTVDESICKFIDDVVATGLEWEESFFSDGSQPSTNSYPTSTLDFLSFVPDEWAELSFSTYLPDGSKVPLLPGGEGQPVNMGNWRNFIKCLERCRLLESSIMFKAFRDGLSAVLPMELLPMFTPNELEQLVSGTSMVDVALLRQCTEYEDISPDSATVCNFWKVLESLTYEERTLFLRFVWARSRLPGSALDFPMNFRLQGVKREHPDSYLPQAQTCFFSLALPNYSTLDIMKEKLLYAINNSPNMDADVRINTGEGWSDS